jgi:hypothetical protein
VVRVPQDQQVLKEVSDQQEPKVILELRVIQVLKVLEVH